MKPKFFIKTLLFLSFFILFIYASSPINEVRFELLNNKSSVKWSCDRHIGVIQLSKGEIKYKYSEPFSANFTIDMTTIMNSDIENKLIKGTLENTLRSNVFFDVENYPKAYFESNEIIHLVNNDYQISGDFILFDTGICHEFEGTIQLKNDSLFFNAKDIIIDRTDWSINYGSRNNPNPLDEESGIIVSDTIKIGVDMILLKQ